MDRIEQLMKDIKPSVTVPDRGVLRSEVTSTDPNVVTMPRAAFAHREATRRRRTRIAAVAAAGLAAAAVAGAVVVGGNFPTVPGPAQPVPAGPNTTISESAPATPSPSPASPTPSPTSPVPATPSQTTPPSTGGVACTPANIDQLRNDRQPTILPIPAAEQRYYTVLGCADGWLAYVISDEGGQALKLDGGNAWFRLAKLQNGRFLWDVRQPSATVYNWEFQALNNQGLTAQQAMDKEFAEKGIPVTLRPQLVGEGPAGK
ncbi:hypothetical protein QWJ39_12875 [Arthrobacter sp. YD4]|uniref:hypothetical protein n=1 Tax=Arthrobacter sp. YD4 TaxID=3058043 RepID=UPI0025B4BE56|nr:hypothetical protein [Arthrobacter sp. YD4]MDN3937200.1 hypothetical protein [Arthrobacter sp. YD4]